MTKTLEAGRAEMITDEMVKQHGLTMEEYEMAVQMMGRTPNLVELGIISVMWSEHCSYKSTRAFLSRFPTRAPWVICGPGENAGIIDIGDNQALVFKMESHNHPSFIEPYQGAATGVGGILRDVFTMGARPIANLNALRFGDINHPKTPHLLRGVVAGIGGYGNSVGIPTVGGECTFHKSYNGNNLVNAMTVGLVEHDKIFYSAATHVGGSVMYVGSKTGRDGIHGATMASAEFNEESESQRPQVQVGDPFTEKLLLEACLELMAEDAILSIQDMGAAGLTSSSVEMASKGGTGIHLDLTHVPQREVGMTPYEIMLSESQERMLMVVKPGKEDLAKSIFDKWALDCAVIGIITDTGLLELSMHGEKVAEIPVKKLSDQAPVYHRPYENTHEAPPFNAALIPADLSPNDALLQMMASPDICSKAWIAEQYDSMVMNDTLQASGSNAAAVRIYGTKKAMVTSSDCTPRYCRMNPEEGGKQAVAESWRNITASGANPMAITNCLNFASPERKKIMGQLVGCIEGMAKACEALDYPVISGNVSLYNETNGEGIDPTPVVGGVGLIYDAAKLVGNAVRVAGHKLYVVGQTEGHLGCTIFQREFLGDDHAAPPSVDLKKEKHHGDWVRMHIDQGKIAACSDVSDGGLYVTLAEMAIHGNKGMKLTLSDDMGTLFGEDQARYVIAVDPAHAGALENSAIDKDIPLTLIGEVTDAPVLALEGHADLPLQKVKDAHARTIPALMGD